MTVFNHFNFNVLDIDRSIKFYDEALGLKPIKTRELGENYARLVYVGDEKTGFLLELTYLYDRKEPYNLGECEFHLAMSTDDYDGMLAKHKAMGIVAFENPEVGIYFITDPDGYWVEIVPEEK